MSISLLRRAGVLFGVLGLCLLSAQAALADGGAWSRTANLPNGRYYAVAAPVANAAGVAGADVLVTGGISINSVVLDDTEIYDPASQTWTQAAPLPGARLGAVAAPLANGDVLVTSGTDQNGPPTGDTEIYDPASNTWSQAASLPEPRKQAMAAPLANGDVLVTGGYANGPTGDTEIYDPASDTWSQAASLPTPASRAVAAPLANGDVLVTDGLDQNGDLQDNTEIYDPTTNTWTAAAPIPDAVVDAMASKLGNGDVLVTGGADVNNNATTVTEIYDPVTNTWSQSPAQPSARAAGVAAPLPSGGALVTSGYPTASVATDSEVFSLDQTSTAVSCSPQAVFAGQGTRCTATVTDQTQALAPAGTVSLSSNRGAQTFEGGPCSLTPVSGTDDESSCQVAFVPNAGATKDTITGAYEPAGGYASSSGASMPIAVSARRTATTLSCQSTIVVVGSGSTQCTAVVSDATGVGDPQPPAGTVTFSGQSPADTFSPSSCSLTPGSGASSSCQVTYERTSGQGMHTISAQYRGDPTYHGSSGHTTINAVRTS